MTTTPKQLFTADPGTITDFLGKRPSDIYNEAVIPVVNSFLDSLDEDVGGLNEASQIREKQLRNDQNFVDQMISRETKGNNALPIDDNLYVTPSINYNTADGVPQKEGFKGDKKIKLSNYGYSSDSSPDYNSNILKIGHANNKLKDGVSAALSKSLATRLGLKTGDYFEAVTAEGKVLRRQYADTVPSTYKGKPLPETVDLYEQSGKNNFGGTVIDIRPLR